MTGVATSLKHRDHSWYEIRDPNKRDITFIVDSWIRSLLQRMTPFDRREIKGETLYPLVAKMTRMGKFLVAIKPNEFTGWNGNVAVIQDDLIIGWICGNPETSDVYYVYVKDPYRGRGVATELVQRLCGTQRVTVWARVDIQMRESLYRKGWKCAPHWPYFRLMECK